jgi:predicted NUDIX family phosphoesterase
MRDKFRIAEIDTTASDPKRTTETVANTILQFIEDELQEDILHATRAAVSEVFKGKQTVTGTDAQRLLTAFADHGAFLPRQKVEDDASLVQALPVVVVRDAKGRVLCLRRKERQPANKLHEKLVIWAGGHVRREDGSNGQAITRAAVRELEEELRLNVAEKELRFLGAVYVDAGGKTSKHVALVFEWRAERDEVAVTLSTAEFFERRGTSLSGKFVPLNQLPEELSAEPEVWSSSIIHDLLPDVSLPRPRDLFGDHR